ncbi:GNAT family N-acetyltransferase [Thalassotalea sp. PS06]|uniref:GNAT family N-acetyltransferase n=1 Tax=Thalassotalea sp. PS06 TaxID=2594005 RepID=UPI00116222D9|nr:GNAT family N-acetyltransferase [Thalassotalea sp. PS06]QDP01259.1 GNAT family N-acetyltransferase [Thalassotalea sp. PS06]
MRYKVNVVRWQQAERQLKSVREKVFCCERRIPYDVEFDHRDRKAHHVLVVDEETQEPIATGRITNDGEISRIAVVISKRKSPVGKEVIQALVKIARKNQLNEVYINSDLDAVSYFASHNFRPVGAVFMEAGIPRQRMACPIREIDFKRFYLSH